ncbi:uncharacterized protein si:dkey-262k9.2 isoform X1 [Hippocampus zosterae]|uniref:uncharacterized protein si:dkey-262k9.2 isoform X1 n=2 Tax=Hippocampus zosterae TaxID=109293 RepID=UPI00223CDB4F|nr:uncharacterized protein si:dkey-262k9.2 isoform X1 [Hippocampus zosterae]
MKQRILVRKWAAACSFGECVILNGTQHRGITRMHFIQFTSLSQLHLKMMRLLLLCVLLSSATVFSDEIEGSTYDGQDDEDSFEENEMTEVQDRNDSGTFVDKTKGEEVTTDQLTLIVIIGTVSVLALSVAVIVAVMVVRRRMHKQQQGIYSVPTEQDQKGAV